MQQFEKRLPSDRNFLKDRQKQREEQRIKREKMRRKKHGEES